MRRPGVISMGLTLLVAVGGCRLGRLPPGTSGGGGFPGVTTGGTTSDGSAGLADAGGGQPQDASLGCGLVTFATMQLPSDVLIVQDRSQAMAGSGWSSTTAAVEALVAQTEGTVNWGLAFFPDQPPTPGPVDADVGDVDGGGDDAADGGGDGGGDSPLSCMVSAGPLVVPNRMNAAFIAREIAATSPGGGQPTVAALTAATVYLSSQPTPDPKFILLATDGQPGCGGGNDATDTIAAVAAAWNRGIVVMVLGTDDPAGEDTLNAMAEAGGSALGTPDVDPVTGIGRVYYRADDPRALQTQIQSISTPTQSCTFVLGGVPPDPTNIAVLVDGKIVPKDPTSGWSYGPNMTSFVFNGSACDRVKMGGVHAVQVVFGCPTGGPINIPSPAPPPVPYVP